MKRTSYEKICILNKMSVLRHKDRLFMHADLFFRVARTSTRLTGMFYLFTAVSAIKSEIRITITRTPQVSRNLRRSSLIYVTTPLFRDKTKQNKHGDPIFLLRFSNFLYIAVNKVCQV